MADNKKLREIYEGDFGKRKRFDDGGSAYSSYSYNPTSFGASIDASGGGFNDPSIAVAPSAGIDPTAAFNAANAQVDPTTFSSDPNSAYNYTAPTSGGSSGAGKAAAGSAAGSAASSGTGALAKLLGLSGSTSSTGLNALAVLAGLAGAASQLSTNKSNPTIAYNPPPLFGGAAGSTGANTGGTSTGYGPAGGYNHANYAGLTSQSPQAGLGYTPRTAVQPTIPNFYTYGQGPQQSFFTNTPQTLTPAVGGHKKGGLIKKYAKGGAGSGAANPPPPPPPEGITTPQRFDFGGPVNATPPQAGITGQPMPSAQPTSSGFLSGALAAAPTAPQSGGMLPPPRLGTDNYGMPQAPGGAMPAQPQHTFMPNQPMPTQTPQIRPAPGVNPNPMMGTRPQLQTPPRPMMQPPQRPTMRASGGNISMPDGSAPNTQGNGNVAKVVTGSGNPLSQAARRSWSGPSSTPPGQPSQNHAGGGPLSTVSRHVVGPGDGTSDDIPARLANGEYVMDAQTVAMVGNGSNDAGAKKLDQFRANIRQHKGKALAQGKMAPDAHKNLKKYL
jgi:hypothetical protein